MKQTDGCLVVCSLSVILSVIQMTWTENEVVKSEKLVSQTLCWGHYKWRKEEWTRYFSNFGLDNYDLTIKFDLQRKYI